MPDKFEVLVEKAWGHSDYEEWQVVIRRGGSGNVIQPFFQSKTKAERVAAALYKILLPEFDREEAAQKLASQRHTEELARRPKPKPFKPTNKMPRIDAFKCSECEELFVSGEEGEPVYECSRCGQIQVEERRCEQCHIFMARMADSSCPHCEAAIEDQPETVLAVRDPKTDQLHEVPTER